MSLSAALSNASSGLSAVTRSAELVSNNVANAMTEGYGRREIDLASSVVGGRGAGVQVVGVSRVVNQPAINDRRLAEAGLGLAEQNATFYGKVENLLGSPDQESSLTGRIARLEAELISATATPENAAQLGAVMSAAKDIAALLNSGSDAVQSARQDADRDIGVQVKTLNSALAGVADLNDKIQTISVSGGDATGLMDQRQKLIDDISTLVPIRELPREYGRIALATPNGTMLVEGEAGVFSFETTSPIVAEMTLAGGALSGLTLTGASSTAGTAIEAIEGGAIAGNFALRDSIAPSAQTTLDGLARTLIERVTDPAVDPTIGTGPGLFTDNGGSFLPADELGLAGRLSVNPTGDPEQGGDVWRLRDGFGAVAPGAAGNRSILSALSNVLSGNAPTGESSSDEPINQLGSDLMSVFAVGRLQAEKTAAFGQAQVDTFAAAEAAFGVDTDQEMQKLLLIEQSYAANAKIIEAIDQMMQSLLRI